MTDPSGDVGGAEKINFVSAGRVARAHGVGGRLRVLPSIESPERTLPGREVFLYSRPTPDPDDPDWRRYKVESAREISGACLLKLEGLDDRREAEERSGCFIFVATAELPGLPGDSYYVYRLCSMTAQTEDGRRIGLIRDVLDMPGQPVLVVESDSGDEVLVPFLRRFIRSVNEDDGRVIVAEINGLLEQFESE